MKNNLLDSVWHYKIAIKYKVEEKIYYEEFDVITHKNYADVHEQFSKFIMRDVKFFFHDYDDVCEELGIAFCGPMGLTEEGEKRFSEILDLKVDIYTDRDGYKNAVLRIDDESAKVWKRRLRIAKEFLKEWQVIVAKRSMINGSSKLMNNFNSRARV